MEVHLLNCPDEPEKLVTLACRNDYYEGWICDDSYEEVMEPVKGDTTEEKKKNLIEKTMKRGHWGPFETCHLTFAMKGVSRVTMAQITRHRHATFDVQSGRYCEMDSDNVHKPDIVSSGDMGRRSDPMDGIKDYNDKALANLREDAFDKAVDSAFSWYQDLLDYGLPPETARRILPQSTQVNIVMTMNLRAILHLADMRGEADAQKEARDLTEEILSIVEDECPITMNYYKEELQGRKNRLAP